MIERLVAKMVISFVLSQIEKFHDKIDWEQLEKDLDAKVRDLVPGSWFDDEAVAFVHTILSAFKAVLGQGDHIKPILQLLAQKKYEQALVALKELLLGQVGHVVPFTATTMELNHILA